MGRKLYRNADSEFLVSKIREVGSRSKVDRVKLVSASMAISNRDTSSILAGLGNIASDGLVSSVEKRQLDMLFRQLKAEYPTVASEAEKYKELPDWNAEYTAQLEAYEKAYSDFSSLLSEILKDMKASSPVSQAQLSSIAQAYYTALSALDSTLQQFRYGIDRMEFRYKATQTQTKPDAEDVTLEEVPTLSSTDKFLWRRQTIYYTSGKVDVTVDLIGVYGDSGTDGKDAKVCTIDCDRSVVTRNDRSTGSLDYTFTITVQGMAGAVTVKVNGVDETASLVQDGTKYTLKKTIPLKQAYSLSAVLYLDGVEKDRCDISVIDETKKSVFIGYIDSMPFGTVYGMFIDGDYFIPSKQFGTFLKNVPYVLSDGEWKELEDSDEGFPSKMLDCLGGILSKGGDIKKTETVMYMFVKNLAAQSIVAEQIFSNNISSENFQEDENGFYAINGYRLEASNENLKGIIRAAYARFFNIDIKGGTIENVSIKKKDAEKDSIIFQTQDKIEPNSFPTVDISATLVEEEYLSTAQTSNGSQIYNEQHEYSMYSLYKNMEEDSSSDGVVTYDVNDFSFVSGFDGTYIFKGFTAVSSDGAVATSTMTVGDVVYSSIATGMESYAQEIEVPVAKGQLVTISFKGGIKNGTYSKFYYRKAFALIASLFGEKLEACLSIKEFRNVYTGNMEEWKKNTYYYLTKESIETNDLYIRTPLFRSGDGYYTASSLDSAGVKIMQNGVAVNPSSCAYRRALASTDVYSSFSSIETGLVVRLVSSITISFKGKDYTVTRIQRTEDNVVFMNDSGSVLTIDKNNYWKCYIPQSISKTYESGIVAPYVYTLKDGVGSIGSIDNAFGNIYTKNLKGDVMGNVTGNLTGNVNSQGTFNKVWGAVFN